MHKISTGVEIDTPIYLPMVVFIVGDLSSAESRPASGVSE
jgi:predicted component of type VI protein secretion system